MRIVIQDSWPNLPVNAEKEFIKRFLIASERAGVSAHVVVTSDDIYAIRPDAVVVSHEFSRKLTEFPTIGLIWSPLRFFETDPYRVKSILSYDGYLAGNNKIQQWLNDLTFSCGVPKPVAKELFLPTTYEASESEKTVDLMYRLPEAAYVGVHWDGARHTKLFKELAEGERARFYGPEDSWKAVGNSYAGELPFDGRSVMRALAAHRAVLCLHKNEHRIENTPSMRIFEACSIGAIPICDEIGFARTELSDVALFVDMRRGPAAVADQIKAHLDWIDRNLDEATDRAERGRRWFNENWSLETKIKRVLIPHIESVALKGQFRSPRTTAILEGPSDDVRSLSLHKKEPLCEIVIRTGGRSLEFLDRAASSVVDANSDDCPLGIIIVDYNSRKDIADYADSLNSKIPTRYVKSKKTGFRSTALWDGIRAAKAKHVAHLDDDDTVFPNHYKQLLHTLTLYGTNVAYSGVVLKEDDPDKYFHFPNFDGPLAIQIEERRSLKFLESFDLKRLATFDNFIQSNTWMARTDFIQGIIGEDPELIVVEDVYLYLLMASRGPFAFSGGVSAAWHWRSYDADNSMFSVAQSVWAESVNRVRRRLSRVPFLYSTLPGQITGLNPDAWELSEEKFTHEISLNTEVRLNKESSSLVTLVGFHSADFGDGIWTRQPEAVLSFTVTPMALETGFVAIIEVAGAYDPNAHDAWFEIVLPSGNAIRRFIDGWDKWVRIPVPVSQAVTSKQLSLGIRCLNLVEPANQGSIDARNLGACVRSIKVMSIDEYTPFESAVVIGSDAASFAVGRSGLQARIMGDINYCALTSDVSFAVILGHGPYYNFTIIRGDEIIEWEVSAGGAWIYVLPMNSSLPCEINYSDKSFFGQPEPSDVFDLSQGGSISSIYSDAENNYRHAGMHIGCLRIEEKSFENVFVLIQVHNGKTYWEARPGYGVVWTILNAEGEIKNDDQGQVARGLLSDLLFKEVTGSDGPSSCWFQPDYENSGTSPSHVLAKAILQGLVAQLLTGGQSNATEFAQLAIGGLG